MKTLIFSIVMLMAASSFACDQLIGTWACSGNGTSTDTYTKTDGVLQVVSTERDGTASTIILDGVEHTMTTNGIVQTYKGTMTCTDLVLDVTASAYGQTVQGRTVGKVKIDGNTMTVEETNQMSGDEQPTHEVITCTKQ